MKPKSIEERVVDTAIRVAKNVIQLRKAGRITQAELAHRAGITIETLARFERVSRGRTTNANPSLATLLRIATALEVDPARLLLAS